MPGILRLLIGDLVIGQKVEIVLRVRFPDMPVGAHTTAFFTVSARDGVLYAGSDGELRELAGQLLAEESAFSAPLPELDRRAHFSSGNLQRSHTDPGALRLDLDHKP